MVMAKLDGQVDLQKFLQENSCTCNRTIHIVHNDNEILVGNRKDLRKVIGNGLLECPVSYTVVTKTTTNIVLI